MAKQSEVHRGINPGFASMYAPAYLSDIRTGLYGKLPNPAGLSDDEVVLMAAVDGLAEELAKASAKNVPLTADQLRVRIMRQMAERILCAEGDVREAYSGDSDED